MKNALIRLLINLAIALIMSLASLESKATATQEPVDSRPTRDPIHAPWSIEEWCSQLKSEIKKLRWSIDPCAKIPWKIMGRSVLGKPLPIVELGESSANNTTLVISMVHGDENTPLYIALKLAHYLKENEAFLRNGATRVVIAPMVNPDGFFRKTRTRTNAHKVDVNRNLPTRDWHSQALKLWRTKFGSNARRFPGHAPSSEPETLFQEELLKTYKPQKVLSIHAPLNFMDYDGPSTLTLARFPKDYIEECLKLKRALKATPGGFFPGSLGNYAGQEMGIPTLTLELPSANPDRAEGYWKTFEPGIRTMIEYRMPDVAIERAPPKSRSQSNS
ncbi:MAG: succinylglutamate desuccinylase/aspartoacylase family protein [Bdellovibrionales bacterium]|nr:succinylglutamate desuccinylase/aspartoacylase family protein [Bdellovibrionales bacterium]